MVQLGLMQAGETMPGVDTPAPSGGGAGGSGGGGGGVWSGDNVRDAADKDLGFAIEMQIQVKRAEREKKRQVRFGVWQTASFYRGFRSICWVLFCGTPSPSLSPRKSCSQRMEEPK